MASRSFLRLFALLVLLGAGLPSARATVEGDWAEITRLDAGPGVTFHSQAEARTGSLAHLQRQESALRHFLSAYPADARAFEARMRLVRLLQIRANLQTQSPDAPRAEAARLLEELDHTATGAQRVEVDFVRVTSLMRSLRPEDVRGREALLAAARRFQASYPAERRVPALLAEVATLFDREPETQRALVQQARQTVTDPALKRRLEDDAKRLSLLGQPLKIRIAGPGGSALDLANYRGKVVVLVIFAEFSPPATETVAALQRAYPLWPAGRVQMLGFSLDRSPEELTKYVNRINLTWPIGYDGQGWQSPLVRGLGINRLPTVWLIDAAGVLRSLNGADDPLEQVRALLRKG